MNIDVSEIKEFRHCKRKWQLSSRNQFHMTPVVVPTAFKLGTTFHESLHKLYLGKPLDEITEFIKDDLRSTNEKDIPMLLSMITGYAREVMPNDAKFKVMNIEWHFNYTPMELLDQEGIEIVNKIGVAKNLTDVHIAGSIDMIALDTETGLVWGFEHKTAKNFRNDTYLWMDEQPRLYYAALKKWVAQYNLENNADLKLGGVFINEVRKLIRVFEAKRSALSYADDDLRNFLIGVMTSVAECHKYVNDESLPRIPSPDMMTCSMCQFNTICNYYQYQNLDSFDVLHTFTMDFKVREQDHLEEKEEV